MTFQIMTYHPQRYGGVQIRENGRAIGSMKSKASAKALCDAINIREAPSSRSRRRDVGSASKKKIAVKSRPPAD